MVLEQACQTGGPDAARLLLKCGPQLSFRPSKCLKLAYYNMKRLSYRKKLRILPNCGPLTIFQSLNVIVRPAHGFEFDMSVLE
jgi:hypothetical protein